jgi:hypothetical protein
MDLLTRCRTLRIRLRKTARPTRAHPVSVRMARRNSRLSMRTPSPMSRLGVGSFRPPCCPPTACAPRVTCSDHADATTRSLSGASVSAPMR